MINEKLPAMLTAHKGKNAQVIDIAMVGFSVAPRTQANTPRTGRNSENPPAPWQPSQWVGFARCE